MKHKKKLATGGVLAIIAGLVPLYIEIDRWIVERRQMMARQDFEARVMSCHASGGKWWKGECIDQDR